MPLFDQRPHVITGTFIDVARNFALWGVGAVALFQWTGAAVSDADQITKGLDSHVKWNTLGFQGMLQQVVFYLIPRLYSQKDVQVLSQSELSRTG